MDLVIPEAGYEDVCRVEGVECPDFNFTGSESKIPLIEKSGIHLIRHGGDLKAVRRKLGSGEWDGDFRSKVIDQIRYLRKFRDLMKTPASCRMIPNGAQERVIKIIATGRVWQLLLTWGNGTGKSSLLAWIMDQIMNGVNNPYFDYEYFRDYPYPKKCYLVGTPASMSDDGAMKTEIKKWMRCTYTSGKKSKSYDCFYKFPSGWEITAMTYEQEPSEFEGPTMGFIANDEPVMPGIYKALVSRQRMGCLWIMAMTPLRGAGYLKKAVADAADVKITEPVYKGWDGLIPEIPDGAVVWIKGNVYENSTDRGVRGVLEPRYIERMVSKYDPEEHQARVWGDFMHLAGMIIKTYDPLKHFMADFLDFPQLFANGGKVPAHWPKRCIIDPHGRRPAAIIWTAMDERGRSFIIDEWPDFDKYGSYDDMRDMPISWKSLIEVLKYREQNLYWDKRAPRQERLIYLMDPRGGKGSPHGLGDSPVDYFRKNGIFCDLRINTNKDIGIDKVKSGFELDETYLFPHCRQTDEALRQYVWKEHRANVADRTPREETGELGSDFVDCLRYYEQRKPGSADKIEEIKQKRRAYDDYGEVMNAAGPFDGL